MIDLLVLTHNRREFTQACLENLAKNTNWAEVSKLVIYDDLSSDGTREVILKFAKHFPVQPEIRIGKYGSPVRIMNEFLFHDSKEPIFAKIDSDTMVPPFWLDECLKVMSINSDLDFLGIEAFRPVKAGKTHRGYEPARFIGGIGMMRTRAFSGSQPTPNGRQGFTIWQEREIAAGRAVAGWIDPALPVFLLDHLPREPWRSLSKQYIAEGWQRVQWGEYPEDRKELWEWWCE